RVLGPGRSGHRATTTRQRPHETARGDTMTSRDDRTIRPGRGVRVEQERSEDQPLTEAAEAEEVDASSEAVRTEPAPTESDEDLPAEDTDEVVHTSEGEVLDEDEGAADAETIPVSEVRTPAPHHE